jgi:large subunit ribosomal protein L21
LSGFYQNFPRKIPANVYSKKLIMIAVIKIGGSQSIVSVGDVIDTNTIKAEAGETVKFDVLLTAKEDGTDAKIGAPLLDGIQVSAKIIEHGRGDKIRVYKMKKRKRYRKLQGHRQNYTRLEITAIGGSTAKATKKVAEKPAPTEKKPVVKKTEKKVVAKKVADKK